MKKIRNAYKKCGDDKLDNICPGEQSHWILETTAVKLHEISSATQHTMAPIPC